MKEQYEPISWYDAENFKNRNVTVCPNGCPDVKTMNIKTLYFYYDYSDKGNTYKGLRCAFQVHGRYGAEVRRIGLGAELELEKEPITRNDNSVESIEKAIQENAELIKKKEYSIKCKEESRNLKPKEESTKSEEKEELRKKQELRTKQELRKLNTELTQLKQESRELGIKLRSFKDESNNLESKKKLIASVKELFSGEKRTRIKDDHKKELLRALVANKAILCSKVKLQDVHVQYKLNALDDQYYLLQAEFFKALEARHNYNLKLRPIPGGVGEDEWVNRCNQFRAAGIRLLNDIDSNIPKNCHGEVPITFMYSAMRYMKNKVSVENDKDLDGEKIFLINQALERARRELEFIPDKKPVDQKQLDAHFDNRKQIHLLSQQMLGHSNPGMQTVGIGLVIFAAACAITAALCAVPTFGASVLVPAALVVFLPFLQPALLGLAGLAIAVLNREKGGAKATSHYKQQVKEMNKEINEDIKGRYEVKDKDIPFFSRTFGGRSS